MYKIERRGGNEHIVFLDGFAIASFIDYDDAVLYVEHKDKEVL